jgi:tetratricopeptide (TPR) repeat protein
LIASGIGLRAELAWTYAYCGALEKGLEVVDRAFQVAQAKQPAWKAFPQAAKVRMYLLQGDVLSARQAAGDTLLEPISIPYARYTIFLSLANIELAVSERDDPLALTLAEDLLKEAFPLTRVDIPEVLRWKAKALRGLGRLDESLQVLSEARSLAEGTGCHIHLWPILADLAEVQAKLGHKQDAGNSLEEGRKIAAQVAESLREIGLTETFLNQPRVRNLMQASL